MSVKNSILFLYLYVIDVVDALSLLLILLQLLLSLFFMSLLYVEFVDRKKIKYVDVDVVVYVVFVQ